MENNNLYEYSASVQSQLQVNGSVLEVGQLGPERCFVRDPIDLPASKAELILTIDDNTRRMSVYLPFGVSKDSREVPYHAVPATLPES